MVIKLKRYLNRPILRNKPENHWEAATIYNAGAIYDNELVHLFYRATDKNCNGRECQDYLNYIGYAVSKDVIHFSRDDKFILGPIKHSQEARGCEDPRVTKIEDKYYMLYTGFGGRFDGDFRICLATSNNLVDWERQGVLLDESNKDAALFPMKINDQFVLIHRREPAIWIGYSNDLKTWKNHKILATIIEDSNWENFKIGLAGPPIETEKGWILIYHGVSKCTDYFKGRGEYRQYSLGIMLLDKEDPSKVIYRQKEPILFPELDWEKEKGYVPNVVFSCGHVIIGNTLFVYYGGADTYTGLATCKLSDIISLFDKVGESDVICE